MLLGNVAIDPDSWDIQAVEYKDPKVSFKEYVDVGIKSQRKETAGKQSGAVQVSGSGKPALFREKQQQHDEGAG